MTNTSIPIVSSGVQAEAISARWGFALRPRNEEDPFYLEVANDRLQLRKADEPRMGPVVVDFCSTVSRHRLKYGGGRSEMIAKAVHVRGAVIPSVVDATAGLGRDAFILASLGCRVHMMERNFVAAALLDDGLRRAGEDAEIGGWVRERLTLTAADSHEAFAALPFKPDVIYLDPMFPEKKNSAHVKKEMRVFQELIGTAADDGALLEPALRTAGQRVVVKRSIGAPWLNDRKPHAHIKGKTNRFDIYMVTA